ncbi:MAG: CBS domain-containing protein [Saprospiraceae bacterium]|nr:CBS domain-containing protein [Saprospiraceae bacterium]
MIVKEIINTPVATLNLDADVASARDLMTLKKISCVPIVHVHGDDVEIEGIVSFHDLVGVYDDTVPVSQVMTRKIYAVTPDTSIQKAAEVMIEKKIHHLVVMDGEELVGIISALDFVNLIAIGAEV